MLSSCQETRREDYDRVVQEGSQVGVVGDAQGYCSVEKGKQKFQELIRDFRRA